MSDTKGAPRAPEAVLLQIAYEGVKAEYERIDNLLKLTDTDSKDHPLGEHHLTIHNKYKGPKERAYNLLETILYHLETIFPDSSRAATKTPEVETSEVPEGVMKIPGEEVSNTPEGAQENRLKEAWEAYATLRTTVMPALSSELLAVIGGLYLQKRDLDCMPGARQQRNRPSFTDKAKELVKEMADNSGTDWASVLIVGEERLDHSEAEVIRLRFPACDLWSLPLTAHEYGFLVAHKEKAKLLGEKRMEVERMVDLRSYDPTDPPERPDRYLLEVVESWAEVQKGETDLDEYRDKHQKSLEALSQRQDMHLCRLFADAFAAAVAGPAYLFALVHLHLVPGDVFSQPSWAMPAFNVRLVVCLEILQRMNEDPILTRKVASALPFKDIVRNVYPSQEEKIPAIWRWALEAMYPTKTDKKIMTEYINVRDLYGEWIENTFWADLKANFAMAIRKTYENWEQAQDLKGGLTGTVREEIQIPNKLTLLNAAWAARHESPDQLQTIQSNALSLLSRGEPQQSEQDRDIGAADQEEQSKEGMSGDIEIVRKALLSTEYEWESEYVEEMIDSRKIQTEKVNQIQKVLRDLGEKDAFDALLRITSRVSRS